MGFRVHTAPPVKEGVPPSVCCVEFFPSHVALINTSTKGKAERETGLIDIQRVYVVYVHAFKKRPLLCFVLASKLAGAAAICQTVVCHATFAQGGRRLKVKLAHLSCGKQKLKHLGRKLVKGG